MASATEDLDFNPFFLTLQKKFPKIYEKAQENCWLICVPKASILPADQVTQTVIETHIFRPSPYFKDQFESICKPHRQITLKDTTLTTDEGFQYNTTASIVSEELFYNKLYQPFKVVCIDQVLNAPPEYDRQRLDADPFAKRQSFQDHIHFLHEFVGYDAIARIDEQLRPFKNGYLYVAGFLDHLVAKVESLCTAAVETAFTRGKSIQKLQHDQRLPGILREAVECYVLDRVYAKLIAAVEEENAKVDHAFGRKLQQYSTISPLSLGVPENFICDLSRPISLLLELGRDHTPFGKAICIKQFLEQISYTVEDHVRRSQSQASVVLATDDLIPLVVTSILRSGFTTLPSHILFMEKFGWSIAKQPELSYNLVTMQAALHFINEQLESSIAASSKPSSGPPSPSTSHQRTKGMSLSSADPVSPTSTGNPTSAPSSRGSSFTNKDWHPGVFSPSSGSGMRITIDRTDSAQSSPQVLPIPTRGITIFPASSSPSTAPTSSSGAAAPLLAASSTSQPQQPPRPSPVNPNRATVIPLNPQPEPAAKNSLLSRLSRGY